MANNDPNNPGLNQETSHLDSWQFRSALISVFVAAAGYLGFSIWAGWVDVVSAFKLVDVIGFAIILGLALLNYLLRFLRWQVYLSALQHRVAFFPSAVIYLAGFSLTTTPGKAGELLRGIFLKKRGMPYASSTAAFFSERLSDLFAMTVLALLGVHQYRYGQFVTIGAVVVGICFLILLFSNFLTLFEKSLATHSSKLAKLLLRVLRLLSKARRCHTPLLILVASVLSVLAWSAEAYAFFLVLQWLGFEATISFAFSVYALSVLAGALSFLPGGLGGAEVVMAGLLILAGMAETQAIAATVIIRLVTLWFAVALGAIAMIVGRRALRYDSNLQKSISS